MRGVLPIVGAFTTLLVSSALATSDTTTSGAPIRNPHGGSAVGGKMFKYMAYMAPWQEGIIRKMDSVTGLESI
jgi:hypothetical protein